MLRWPSPPCSCFVRLRLRDAIAFVALVSPALRLRRDRHRTRAYRLDSALRQRQRHDGAAVCRIYRRLPASARGFTCSPSSGDAFDCSAPLPQLTAGRHTLEIVTFFNSGTGVVESPRSTPLQLMVSGVVANRRLAGRATPRSRRRMGGSSTPMSSPLISSIPLTWPWMRADARSSSSGAARFASSTRVPRRASAHRSSRCSVRATGSQALSIALAPDFPAPVSSTP